MSQHLLLLFPTATILLVLLFLSSPTVAEVVKDIDGNPLETGSSYYVLTAGRGAAGRGGLATYPKPPNICPSYVAQLSDWKKEGMPVSFYPADLSQKEISEDVDTNIVFGEKSFCRDQNTWQLSIDKSSTFYITTNGTIGNPGAETFPNWFKIRKDFGTSYKILFCFIVPAPASGERPENCMQVDATLPSVSNSVTYLSLVPIDNPLPFFGFVFKKASTTTSYYI